jgi:CRP/FNR family transcriptional regulator/CRP/FNR family cyclic AMP-dependent transcriptional regulator
MAVTPFFRDVPPARVERFARGGTIRRYRRSTYVCHQDDPANEIYFLVEGKLEISSVAPTGTRVFHAAIDEPTFVGELGILGDTSRTATVLAVRDADVWAAPGASFLDVITSEPTASRAALQALARQVQAHQALVDDLLFLDLKGRVAKRLLQMVTPDLDRLPDDGVMVPEVTQADLASLCGGSRENVTRILKEFERRGLVRRDGHRYVLRKVGALATIARR